MSPVLLYLLATLDGALSGFRAQAGRIPTVRRRNLMAAAMTRGALTAQLACLTVGAVVGALLLSDPGLYPALARAAWAMVAVYGAFALAVFAALVAWTLPSREIRALAQIIVLGPGTLGRPLVVLVGVAAAILVEPRWEVALLAGLGGMSVFAVEYVLDAHFERALTRWLRDLEVTPPDAG